MPAYMRSCNRRSVIKLAIRAHGIVCWWRLLAAELDRRRPRRGDVYSALWSTTDRRPNNCDAAQSSTQWVGHSPAAASWPAGRPPNASRGISTTQSVSPSTGPAHTEAGVTVPAPPPPFNDTWLPSLSVWKQYRGTSAKAVCIAIVASKRFMRLHCTWFYPPIMRLHLVFFAQRGQNVISFGSTHITAKDILVFLHCWTARK